MSTGVIAKVGITAGDDGGGGSSPIIAPENWACDAKPSGAAVQTNLVTSAWINLVMNSTIPHPEMINPNLTYVGNGRYQNDYGAQITVKGFISGNAYIDNISLTSVSITVGLWDGANIVPDVAKLATWANLRGINQPSSSSGVVFSYEIDVPAGEIFGFTIRRNSGTGDLQLRGYQHTVRAL